LQECQNLIEENRRLQALNVIGGSRVFSSLQYGDCNNAAVENVVLQNKLETLHWQLKQVISQQRQVMEC